jgi:uncharacterized protein YndB with AHSA1/START domain
MRTTVASDAIVQEITIKASAERIFEALTNPDQRVKWWGSEGRFQTTHMESDLRPGGRWAMRGIGMGGRPFSVVGEYRSIERPRLLVFTWLPDWQGDATESLVRFDLEEANGVTTVRLTHSGLVSETSRESHKGWPQILAWLRAYVRCRASGHRARCLRGDLSGAADPARGSISAGWRVRHPRPAMGGTGQTAARHDDR